MGRPRTPIGAHGAISTKRTGNTWEAQTRVRDLDGRSRVVRARAGTQAKAVAALKSKLVGRSAIRGAAITPETPISTVAEQWLRNLAMSGRTPGTIERYEHAACRHVIPGLGHFAVREVTPAAVGRFLRAVPANRKMVRVVLGHIMRMAVQEGAIAFDPVPLALPLSELGQPSASRVPRALRPHELSAVRQAVETWERSTVRTKSIPLRDIVLLQLATGLRISELLALTHADCDLDRGLLLIRATLTMPRGGIVRSPVKTPSGNRVIRLPRVAIEVLQRRLDECPCSDRPNRPIFPSAAGTWLWPHNVRRAWREARAMSEVDISFVRPHTLRKTAGTEVVETYGLLAGSKLLGHASTAITEAAYHDRSTHVDDFTQALDALLSGWD